MQILVFKTDIREAADHSSVRPLLDAHPGIGRWSIDLEDCDCVLRIEGTGVTPENVIDLIGGAGFTCSELPD